MILPIYLYGQPVLRKVAEDITPDYPELKSLIESMFDTMHQAEGIGLAAPQVGLAIRLVVVDLDVLSEDFPEFKDFRRVYINAHIIETSDEGPDGVFTPVEVEYMAAQEEFKPVFLLNASIGKSWYIDRKYNFGFSLNLQNITNNRCVKTGGYEQTRLIDSESAERFYRFDSKYFYMQGINYMLNLYFRF